MKEDDGLPASVAQERLWLSSRIAREHAPFNLMRAFRAAGALDVEALERSVDALVRRHDVLRSVFSFDGGSLRSVLLPPSAIRLRVVDLRTLETREAQLRRLLRTEAAHRFDTAAGPLARFVVVHIADDEHCILINGHRLVLDERSMSILFRELGSLYRGFATGEMPALTSSPLQYRDYAARQRESLPAETLEQHLSYWLHQLADLPQLLAVPADRPRGAVRGRGFDAASTILCEDLERALHRAAEACKAPCWVLLLGALQALLVRYTSQEDVVIGCRLSSRSSVTPADVVGCFVETLPLRVRVDGNMTFRHLVELARKAAVEADAHRQAIFERTLREFQVEKPDAHHPVFQVTFAFDDDPPEHLTLPGLRLEAIVPDGHGAECDLECAVARVADGLSTTIVYSRDLFDGRRIERLLDHYRTLLEAAVAEPDVPLHRLPLMSDVERRVMIQLGAPSGSRSSPVCVLELFEQQVARAPHAVAAVFEDEQVTYEELDWLSGELASRLLEKEVGPEVIVALLVERSIEMLVAILGVWKTGAAYLPLDPESPTERLRFMLNDSGAGIVVASPGSGGQDVLVDRPAIVLAPWEGMSAQRRGRARPETPQVRGHLASSLIYVMYTSGSTGEPKGVMVEHGGVSNTIAWLQSVRQLTAGDRVLLKTPLTFDVSVTEILWPLAYGATVVIAKPDGHRDPEYLVDVIRRQRVNVVDFVPSMLTQFLQAEGAGRCDSLSDIISAGEPLSREAAAAVLSSGIDARLHNLYGPTEASIYSTYYVVSSATTTPPIGRPIANTQAFIVDAHDNLVPIGIAGELLLGGIGLARGYLNRPELTGSAFRTGLLPEYPQWRLYRTGDICRYREDGNIEYLGRKDNQVKIFGVRIELGEVEAALLSQEFVRGAAVVVCERGRSREKYLVGYVVWDGEAFDETRIKQSLARCLPRHMIPAKIVTLERLPLSSNGKIDRQALKELERRSSQTAVAAPAALSAAERMLASIWANVLEIPEEKITATADFFAVGGNSLRSAELAKAIRHHFGVDVPLRNLYLHSKLNRMAELLTRAFG